VDSGPINSYCTQSDAPVPGLDDLCVQLVLLDSTLAKRSNPAITDTKETLSGTALAHANKAEAFLCHSRGSIFVQVVSFSAHFRSDLILTSLPRPDLEAENALGSCYMSRPTQAMSALYYPTTLLGTSLSRIPQTTALKVKSRFPKVSFKGPTSIF
jgi:hypothetical protein